MSRPPAPCHDRTAAVPPAAASSFPAGNARPRVALHPMRLIGSPGTGLYVLEDGVGRGRVLHVREHELVLFNEHVLDPFLVAACLPCDIRHQVVSRVVALVGRRGQETGPHGTLALRCNELDPDEAALVRSLALPQRVPTPPLHR